MIELGHVTDRKPLQVFVVRRVGFFRIPMRRASSTTVATCRSSISLSPSFHRPRPRPLAHDFAMRAVNVEYVPRALSTTARMFVCVERIGTTSITYDHAAYRVETNR